MHSALDAARKWIAENHDDTDTGARLMIAKINEAMDGSPSPSQPSPTDEDVEMVVKDRADWLVDAIAGATQDRRFLRGDEEEDRVATEAIYLNGAKAIRAALAAMPRQGQVTTDRSADSQYLAGVKVGWNLGLVEDTKRYNEIVEARMRDRTAALIGKEAE